MPKGDKLTPKEELFCRFFATDRDCFGNGVQAYIKAYGSKVKYMTAKAEAWRLLQNPTITSRIRELVDIYISDEIVDKELGSVIMQYADFSSKVAAIREYNKLKGRITEKYKHEWIDENADLSNEQLKKALASGSKG